MSTCTYVISTFNPDSSQHQAAFLLTYHNKITTDVRPSVVYSEELNMNEAHYYRVLSENFDFGYAAEIVISLKTYLGDADLFVSENLVNPGPDAWH